MAPKWLPDWRKPSQYPDPSKAEVTRLDWAWQFLRRNPEYQQLWSNLIAPNYKPAHVTWSMKQTAGSVRRVRDRVRAHLKAPPSANYQLAQFETLFGIITIPPDPSKRKARLRFAAHFIRYARKPSHRPGKSGWVYNVPTSLQDHEVLVWFDLRWPTKAQLTRAKQLLAQQTREEKLENIPFSFRYRPKKYINYLRILDAKAANAPDAEVAKVIYPQELNIYPEFVGSHRVRDDRNAAERLRDNPWRIVAGGK